MGVGADQGLLGFVVVLWGLAGWGEGGSPSIRSHLTGMSRLGMAKA